MANPEPPPVVPDPAPPVVVPVPDPAPPVVVVVPPDPAVVTIINSYSAKFVAVIRTILPAFWGTVVATLLQWFVVKGLISSDVAGSYQGIITTVSAGFLVSAATSLVYLLGRWLEQQTNPVSRFISKLILWFSKTVPAYTNTVKSDTVPAK